MARTILNESVQHYAYHYNNKKYRDSWNRLYKVFLRQFHINLKVRAKNRKMSPIQYAEQYGFINLLLGLALILFCNY